MNAALTKHLNSALGNPLEHRNSALELPEADGDAVPEWIHLLPAGPEIETRDDFGPFSVGDLDALIARSFSEVSKLAVDVNHAIDTGAPKGEPSPAVGWITEMEARDDGLWGRVKWNQSGRDLLTDEAYSGISPVTLHHPKTKEALAVARASLVNTPNLRGLTALNSEKDTNQMDWRKFLLDQLGLEGGASDEDIKAAMRKALKANDGKPVKATMSALAKALDLDDDTEGDDLVKALNTRLSDAPSDEEVTELQKQLNSVTTELNTLKDGRARDRAEAFIDGAISDLRVGLNSANRERYIKRHMADPEGTEADINDMPKLNSSGTSIQPPAPKDGEIRLNSAQQAAARQLGMSDDDYIKALNSEQTQQEVN